MLLRVPLLLVSISVVRGTLIPESSQDVIKEEKGLDGWLIFIGDKIKGTGGGAADDYAGGNTTITGDTGNFFNPKSTEEVAVPEEVITAIRATNPRLRQEDISIDITVVYTATVPITPDVVQIKVDIKKMNIQGPVEGDCGNDSLVITGTNPGPEIPVLCGVVSDQTLYLDVDNVKGPIVFTMTINVNISIDQTWDITITKLKEADSVERRCLQYKPALTGTIESFNYGGNPTGMMLNEQTYSICFGYVVHYCQIAINFARLDLGPVNGDCTNGNYLFIGDDKHCGDRDNYSIIANATGPINIGVRSGAYNDMDEEGFSATYSMIYCGE